MRVPVKDLNEFVQGFDPGSVPFRVLQGLHSRVLHGPGVLFYFQSKVFFARFQSWEVWGFIDGLLRIGVRRVSKKCFARNA